MIKIITKKTQIITRMTQIITRRIKISHQNQDVRGATGQLRQSDSCSLTPREVTVEDIVRVAGQTHSPQHLPDILVLQDEQSLWTDRQHTLLSV